MTVHQRVGRKKTTGKLIKCPICGEFLHIVTHVHAEKHDLTLEKFVEKFPELFNNTLSSKQTKDALKLRLEKNKNEKEEKILLYIQTEMLRNKVGLTKKQLADKLPFSYDVYLAFKLGRGMKSNIVLAKEYLEKKLNEIEEEIKKAKLDYWGDENDK